MRKIIPIAIAVILTAFPVHAASGHVSVDVPVECEAYSDDHVHIVTAEPLDDGLEDTLKKGVLEFQGTGSGSLVLDFTKPGTYHYKVLQDADLSEHAYFDEDAYIMDVFVTRDEEGNLYAEPVLYKEGNNKKEVLIRFLNLPRGFYPGETEQPGTQQEQPGSTDSSSNTAATSSPVKTGDDTPVRRYTVMMAASLGLFLSVVALSKRGKRRRKENIE